MKRVTAGALAGAVLGLVVAAPLGAKDGVVAKARVPVPRAAEPGTRVTFVWELTLVADGRSRPFTADGVFMRLFGPNGSRTPRAYATHLADGRYRATARVPRGGVRRVVVGLLGWNDNGPAPVRFPVIGRVFR